MKKKTEFLMREVLLKNLKFFNEDNYRFIFKTGGITVTLYEKPKSDPRQKLHIQSNDQSKNLQFISDKISSPKSEGYIITELCHFP